MRNYGSNTPGTMSSRVTTADGHRSLRSRCIGPRPRRFSLASLGTFQDLAVGKPKKRLTFQRFSPAHTLAISSPNSLERIAQLPLLLGRFQRDRIF